MSNRNLIIELNMADLITKQFEEKLHKELDREFDREFDRCINEYLILHWIFATRAFKLWGQDVE